MANASARAAQEQRTRPYILDATSASWSANIDIEQPNGFGQEPLITWPDYEGALIPSGTSSLQGSEMPFISPKLWSHCLYPKAQVWPLYHYLKFYWHSLELSGAPIEVRVTTGEGPALETSTDSATDYGEELKSDTETELHFLSMSHDVLERQIDLDPDFLAVLNEATLAEGKDSPSRPRFNG